MSTLYRGHYRRRFYRVLALLLVLIVILPVPLSMTQASPSTTKLIVDTDPGVDDAAAIIWLLSQTKFPMDLLGIVTVAGNADVENVTNNVLTLLDAMALPDITVVMGAEQPLNQPMSELTTLLHGPDGLWFVGMQNPHDLSGIPTDATSFYCDTVTQNPGTVILTLGPLTNLANAINQCPNEMQSIRRIIALGGSRLATAPQMDYNFWQDPEATDIVLSSGLPLTLMLGEASGQFILDAQDLQELATEGIPAAQLIAGPMQLYTQMKGGFSGASEAPYHDVAAAMYALGPSAGASQSALVKEVTAESLTRGQTLIGLDTGSRVTMIASLEELNTLAYDFYHDPNFDLEAAIGAILFREPDNARVVLEIKHKVMHKRFMQALTD